MPQFLDLFGNISPTTRGFAVSIIMFAGAIPAFFAGQIADRFGRLAVVSAGALAFAVAAMIQASAYQLPQFIAARGLGGFTQGLFLSNIDVYACRGPLQAALCWLMQFRAQLYLRDCTKPS